MLNLDEDSMYKCFGYRFIKGPETPLAQIYSLGWQVQNSLSYNFDGMKRHDEAGNCIFQYTLSGSGLLEVNGEKYELTKDTAFFSVIPSKHHYYLPKNSKKWEFIFMTLTGNYAISQWNKIQDQLGTVIKLKEQDEIIKYFWEIYRAAINSEIVDGYQTSTIAYEFVMKLLRSLNNQSVNISSNQSSINNSINFMKDNLHKDISLEDIASYVGFSKFYFNHAFTKIMGISPWNYLTKLRLENSIKLLLSTNLTVDEISVMVGYTSSNYFNKVFRKYINTSPGRFREQYNDIKDFTLNL